jgi:7,8-dihydropterin-6-yl-methyl-4-(beta-D-ribofuranosyl)aminobenzene 5'-phosphate synthase
VEIDVLVDNATDGLSSVPDHAETEFARLARNGMQELAGDHLCCACHGLSLLVTARRASLRHAVLFDSGPEEYAFERNATRLGVDLGTVESVVLSHGHWDHGGGMLKALDLIRDRNGATTVPFYAHPDMFRTRGRRLSSGRMLPSRDVPNIESLTARGSRVICTPAPQCFLDEMFYVSGEIPRITSFEQGLAEHYRRTVSGRDWEPDPWLMDERFLALNVTGKGLVILTACSHAGAVNVLLHARECFPDTPLYALIGGLHLAGPNEGIIGETVMAMRAFELRVIGAGHCTGWRAINALANAFGRTVDPSVVGKQYRFSRRSNAP